MLKDHNRDKRVKMRGMQEELDGEFSAPSGQKDEEAYEDHPQIKNEEFRRGDFYQSPTSNKKSAHYLERLDHLSKHIAVKIQEDTPLNIQKETSAATAEMM